ncbi:MAG: serine/threonine protein kinase [Candidatus Hydrogenedentes bacterium]|nr:serine/threonine protein kinase [Candidatus Hydrogenedentota bacterium]
MMNRLEAGYILGKYRVIAELGRGGMGVVYSAEDTVLGRLVALKVLPGDFLTDRAFVKRFQTEAKVIASLSHPNVVHVHSFDIIDGLPVIEMEHIDGGPLSRKFQHAEVDTADVIHYAHGVASALAYCHAMDAVHRDVKPSNILIDKLNMARLADFGIAKVLAEREQSTFIHSVSGIFQGTPLYAPPEAWEGETPTRAWDIYGLGAVIYQGVTGSPPYQANTPLQLAKMVASSSIPSLKSSGADVSDALAELVDEMLRPDPSRRPDSAEVIQRRLQKTPEFMSYACDTRSMPHARVRIRHKFPGLPAKRKRNLAIALVALVTLCSLASLTWALKQSTPDAVTAQERDEPAAGEVTASGAAAQAEWDSLAASSTIADLEALQRPFVGTRAVVLEARIHDAPTPHFVESWLVGISDSGEPQKILAISETSLAVIQLSPGEREGAYAAVGDYAGYADAAASIPRYGTLRGEIAWQATVDGCMGSLVFLNEQDGHATETTVVATEHTACKTTTQFCVEMERSEYLLPILYRELLPRDFAWAREVDALLPSFERGVAHVIPRGMEDGVMAVDGILNETLWEPLGSNETSSEYVLYGWPRAANPRMSLSIAGETLLVALTCSAGPESDAAMLDLYLQDTFPVPLSAAPALHIQYSCETSQTLAEYGTDRSPDGVPACEFALTRKGATLAVEGKIPVQKFGRQATDIHPGERWRINAALTTTDASGQRTAFCRWGFPDETLGRHGAVLILD